MLNVAAAVLLTAGLALAGFVGAGLAAGSRAADPGAATTTTMCTKAHPCTNPGCSAASHGPGDCLNGTTDSVPATTTGSSAPPSCTRAHPCPNPGCTQTGHGPLDCTTTTGTTTTATTSTTTTTRTTTTATTATTPTTTRTTPQQPPTTTVETTTAASLPPPPTTTQAATVPVSPASTTTTQRTTPAPGAPFLPPKLRTRRHRGPSITGSPAAQALPYTGLNLTVAVELAAALLGAGALLFVGGQKKPRRFAFAGLGARAFTPMALPGAEAGEDDEAAPPPDSRFAYRVLIPGVGSFATVEEAQRFVEQETGARRRDTAGKVDDGARYRVVRTEFGTFASARDGEGGSGE